MSQSQISRTLRDETAVARIASILSQERFDSRSALAGGSARSSRSPTRAAALSLPAA